MDDVIVISAFGDNFIYLYRYDAGKAFAVDPADSSAVLNVLAEKKLALTMILNTHHHYDHCGGNRDLKKKTGCAIIGGDPLRVPGIDRVVKDADIINAGDTEIQVIGTPGHTRNDVCFYLPEPKSQSSGIVFTGDTMFVGGCGRVFECRPEQMWQSLMRLAQLPDKTRMYCGHDYTVENYEFALTIEPGNTDVKERLAELKAMSNSQKPTVPSTIYQQRKLNPFLRAETTQIKEALAMPQSSAVEIFAELRRRKDVF